jgi:hypothetical protein
VFLVEKELTGFGKSPRESKMEICERESEGI